MIERQRLYFDGTPLINKHISGVGKVLLETLRALDTEYYNHKYELYVFVPFNEVAKMNRYEFEFIEIRALPYPHKLHSLFSRMRLSPPIDIFLGRGIYIFENYRNWNLILSKSLTYIHDIAFRLHPEFVESSNLRYLNNHIGMWIKRTDKIITVSESSKQEIEQWLAVEGVKVVANAADDDMYPRQEGEIEIMRRKWGIPKQYYLYFGNIEPRKNLINMVRSFRLYVEKTGSSSALILIGGDGWKNQEIREEIDEARKNGVTIIKPNSYVPDEDMPALLSGAVALLQLSWHEGFGMSILHALACGTPVVASDIPSLREASRHNEKNVLYVDPSDIVAIANAIEGVANVPHIAEPMHIVRWRDSIKSFESIVDSL